MTYGIDIRKLVVSFVNESGNKAEASRRYKVSLWCVNDWCKRKELGAKKQGNRVRKIDREELKKHVNDYPDAKLAERAAKFKVSISSIEYQLKKMKITYKKK